MISFTLVTGNKGKLAEWQRLCPKNIALNAVDVDIDEIQSLDPKIIVEHKVKAAYAAVKRPVVVEDISAGLDEFNGLPGPFIKYFEKGLGEGALYILAGKKEAPATVTCTMAYYDGHDLKIVQSVVKGRVVSPRGERGFGFDKVMMLNGQTKTYGELTYEEKDKISHRSIAIRKLIDQLEQMQVSS